MISRLWDSPTTARWTLWLLPVPVIAIFVSQHRPWQWACLVLAGLLYGAADSASRRLIHHPESRDRAWALALPALSSLALVLVLVPMAWSYPAWTRPNLLLPLVVVVKGLYDTYSRFSSLLVPAPPADDRDPLAQALADGRLEWPIDRDEARERARTH